ncbi:MAG: hypothetical protein JW990_15775, partial [Thermoleophilia bacterium]|nr:hypothetical protein [Thermoleophilia bacterium]
FPEEFYNSELGLPYLAADGGLTREDLLALTGSWGQLRTGQGCVMGVDQGSGLHIVVKEPAKDREYLLTVRVHHEPHTDESFSQLDGFMEAFDVRACVIDALPGQHAARAFARRFPGRVCLAYYGDTQKGLVSWEHDKENCQTAIINRTEAFDAWRDAHQVKKRRIPRVEDEVVEYVRQMTNILRSVKEDPDSGDKKARWIRRGPDHYAHADCYAEIAHKKTRRGIAYATILG